jgi:hypothetical protein
VKGFEWKRIMATKKAVIKLRRTVAHGTRGRACDLGQWIAIALKIA